MPFDPNAYVAKLKKFDPDAYLASKQDISTNESLLRGGVQGFTSDIADEVTGAIESLISKKSYEQARNESRKNYAAAREANPISYGTGQVAGGVAQGLATAAIPGGVPARIGIGAALGALQGYGANEDPSRAGIDTLAGAGIGGAFGVAGELLPMGVQGVRNFSQNRAAAALGAERGTIKTLGVKNIRGAGQQALDEGVVTPFSDTTDMMMRNKDVKAKGWDKMSGVIKEIDDSGQKLFSPRAAADALEAKSAVDWRSPINKSEASQFDNTIEAILVRGDNTISLTEAHALRKELGNQANWKQNDIDLTPKEAMARDAYGVVSNQIERAIEAGQKEIGKTDLLITFKKGEQLYSNAKTTDKLLFNRYAKEHGNKMGFGLTNTIVGTTAAAAGGFPGFLAAMGGKRIAEEYGNQTAAKGAQWLANALEQAPQSLGKYAMPLKQAAMRGGQSLAIAHYQLSQRDPEYMMLMSQIQDPENNK